MIDVEDFLAKHPVPGDDEHVSYGAPGAGGGIDDVVDAKNARSVKRQSSTYSSRSRTHTVPVSSPYSSAFGGSLSDSDAGWSESGSGRRAKRKRSTYRYRSQPAVRRVPDDPNDMDACREAALTLLDASPKSSLGMTKRLIEKGYGEVVANDVVVRLVELRLIDDVEYAASAVRSCVARQFGARGTLQELRRKDAEPRAASEAVRAAQEQGAFEEAAWELGRKVARKTEGLDSQVRRRRFWSAGARKGHNPEVLQRVAQELLS